MLRRLALIGILLSIFVFSIRPITDTDIWWHLATGKHIVENREIPDSDFFSFTRNGARWIDHEWLAQVIFFYIYNSFGAIGLVLIKSIFVVLAFYFLYLRTRLHMGAFFSILTLYIAASLSWNAWLERPMIFTFFFTSLLLFLLDSYTEGISDKLSLTPLIMLLWANIHGGFVLGLLILLIYSMGHLFTQKEKSRKLFLITGISLLTSTINPHRYHLLLYPLQYSYQNIHSMFIAEWQSPSFHNPSGFEIILLATIIIFAKTHPNSIHILLTLVFVHLSLFAVRNIHLFAIVVSPIVLMYAEKYSLKIIGGSVNGSKFDINTIEGYLNKMALSQDHKRVLLNRFLPVFLYTLIILAFIVPTYNYLQFGPAFDTSPRGFPKNAVEYLLEERPEGNLYNIYAWGGYIIWKAYPEYRVFIDGRADLYGDFIYEYLSVHRIEPNWEETLVRYKIKIILIPVDHKLDVLLRESENWNEGYRDSKAVVYLKL